MREYLDSWHENGSPWEMWVGEVERLRARFAASIGAGVDDRRHAERIGRDQRRRQRPQLRCGRRSSSAISSS
jgi:anti-sigma factor RsiW